MKVIELIDKLEQYPPDVEVWIDIRSNDGQGFVYQDIVADIEEFPSISTGIKLKSRSEVREKLKKELNEEMQRMDIFKLMKMKLMFLTKDSEKNNGKT